MPDIPQPHNGIQVMAERRQADSVEMLLNMGPQHPSTHGVFRMVLWLDGERIVDVDPVIGYLHRGSEKISEGELYSQVITLFDRLDYVANFANELAFVMAVEKLMGLEVPERAQYIRVILCELTRIASHMLFYGTFGLDAGAMTPILYGFTNRERIQALFESVSGARMMHNYFRIGGVKEDVPEDFEQRVRTLLEQLKRGIQEADDLLTYNEILVGRSRGIGCISPEEAVALGMSGPPLRATGLAEDVRRAEPYSIYERFTFNIPMGMQGDCWDRYYVRMQEMWESVRIIEQALQQMEQGPIINPAVRRMPRPPKGEAYVRTESPRGDFGVYLVSDGGERPYRVKVRTPSFSNLQALPALMRGCYLADCVVILGSLDIVLGEVDR